MQSDTDLWTVITIFAMVACTVVTRSFFFISSKPWPMPSWLKRGLNYAPIAALASVIIPEMVMSQGQLIGTWQDARLFAVLAGVAWYHFKRGIFGTIVCGMAAYLPLHVGLGW